MTEELQALFAVDRIIQRDLAECARIHAKHQERFDRMNARLQAAIIKRDKLCLEWHNAQRSAKKLRAARLRAYYALQSCCKTLHHKIKNRKSKLRQRIEKQRDQQLVAEQKAARHADFQPIP